MSATMTEAEQVYTVKEVAEILKVNPRTVRKMIADGELEGFTVRSEYRVTRRSLDALMQKQDQQKEQ